MYCTLSFDCVQVQTLPTAQVTPALTDSFSWAYDPYTHACKARPLTTAGWTSFSVIVIVHDAVAEDVRSESRVDEVLVQLPNGCLLFEDCCSTSAGILLSSAKYRSTFRV